MSTVEIDYRIMYEDERGKEIIHREIRRNMIEPFRPERVKDYLDRPEKIDEEMKRAYDFFMRKYNIVESRLKQYEIEITENEESAVIKDFREAERYLRNLENAKEYIQFFKAKIDNYMQTYKNIADSKSTIEKRKRNKANDRDRSEKNFKKITNGMRKVFDNFFVKIGAGTASGLASYYYFIDSLPLSEGMKNSLSLITSAVVAILTKPIANYVIDKIENKRIDTIYKNYEYGMKPLREEEMKLTQREERDIKSIQEDLFYKLGDYFPGSVRQSKYTRENGKRKIEERDISELEEPSPLSFMDRYGSEGIL